VARARGPGAGPVRNDPLLARLSSGEGRSIRPNRIKVRDPKGRSKSDAGAHVAKQRPWKRNLQSEIFRETRQELHLRLPGPPTETGPWRGKPRKYRAFLRRRKSRRFARTSWWWTQSCKTGLRKAFFSVTGNLLHNEGKNRGCRLPLGYLSCRSVCDFNRIAHAYAGFLLRPKTGVVLSISGIFWRLIRHDSEQEQAAPARNSKPSIGTHLEADDRPGLLVARDSSYCWS
jgi:hypothetical protein